MPSTPFERVESAKHAIRAILAMDGILERHRDELLSLMIWKITEAEGKYTLRYRSEGSLTDPSAKKHHEHPFPRRWLIAQLKAHPTRVDEILERAFGCVVTIDEHRRLSSVPPHLLGWDRYKAAGIRVFDVTSDCWLE